MLPVDIEASAVLPLRPLNTDPDYGHPGSLDTAAGGPYHCDSYPTPDISACPRVEFPPLGGNVAGQMFQPGFLLIYPGGHT